MITVDFHAEGARATASDIGGALGRKCATVRIRGADGSAITLYFPHLSGEQVEGFADEFNVLQAKIEQAGAAAKEAGQ